MTNQPSRANLALESSAHRLLLIDGNAAMHRAYHAIPPMNSSDGRPVNAVYGFCAMLIKLAHDLTPSHIVVAFDRPAPTFRKKLFAQYQGKRPKMDDELSSQIDIIHELVSAFGIPIYEQDGFEADDIIGTIAHKKYNGQIIIVTGDRDILQLVKDEKVLVYMPTKGLSEGKLYSEKDVVERMGIAPKLIPDFKAFAGDASDNYPGVPGIGPKTAVNLLKEFGDFAGVYKGVKGKQGSMGEKINKRLLDGEESAKLSHDLATIRTNVPIEFNEKDARFISLDTPESCAMLEELRFSSLLKRIAGIKNSTKEVKTATQQQVLF